MTTSAGKQKTIFLTASAAAVVLVGAFVAWTALRLGGDTVTIGVDDIGEAVAAFIGAAIVAAIGCVGMAGLWSASNPTARVEPHTSKRSGPAPN